MQIVKKLLLPHPAIVLLSAVISAAALVAVFVSGSEQSAFAYAAYAFSAYSLAIVTLRAVRLVRAARRRLNENSFYKRYSTDLGYRAVLSLRISFLITLFFCVTKAAAGIYYRSAWFGSMAFYYIVLGTVRYLLLRHLRRDRGDELLAYRRHRLCGYLLLVLTVALAAMSFHAVYNGESVDYPGFLIYAAAGFTFYNLAMAVRSFVRYRRLRDPVLTASKALTLATASVSLFFLQTSLFSVFGNGDGRQRYMNLATGGCVFALIIVIAVLMIRGSSRKISSMREMQQK